MAKSIDRIAREKLVRARTNLLISNGFFGFLVMMLRLEEDNTAPTAWVDGRTIGYNANFINQLTDAECEFVLAHEVMHCCFKHMTRRNNRHPRAWNVAGDHVINLDLKDAGFTLIENRTINGKKFNVCADPKYKGWTTEEVYDDFEIVYIKLLDSGSSEDPGDSGEVRDAPGNANEKDASSQNWDVQIRTAVAVAKGNNAGQIPGSLRRLVEALERPKISWRDMTKAFIDQSLIKDISWSRINRRSFSIGTLMPGLISDRLNHLVFLVDTSGSINMDTLRAFLSEVARALDQGTADQLTVVYADTRVHDVDHFVPGDLVVARELEKGGGGTDFRDSFKWVKENAPDVSCIIYLTDLQVNEFGEEPNCPTLWAVWANSASYAHLAERAPFGTCVHVSDLRS